MVVTGDGTRKPWTRSRRSRGLDELLEESFGHLLPTRPQRSDDPLAEAWMAAAGPKLSAVSQLSSVRRQTAHVVVSHPAHSMEIRAAAPAILEALGRVLPEGSRPRRLKVKVEASLEPPRLSSGPAGRSPAVLETSPASGQAAAEGQAMAGEVEELEEFEETLGRFLDALGDRLAPKG